MSFIDILPPSGYSVGFQNTVDFNSFDWCFKYEYGDNGKRCVLAGNDRNVFLDWVMKVPTEKRCFYELIREEDKVAEFYDIDLSVMLDLDAMTELSHEIIDTFLIARNKVIDHKISRKDLIVLSAHTSTKLSLHVISRVSFFDNNQMHGLFAKDVYDQLVEDNTLFNIDLSVYSRNRCFRMYQSHKYHKTNPLVLFAPERYSYASMVDTLVVLGDTQGREQIKKYDRADLVILQHHDFGEDLCDGLQDRLKQFLNQYPYLELVSKNRINRIDHTTRTCLTDPSDQHSTENMFWFIRNNQLYVHCFCGKGTPICLGERPGVIPVRISPEPFRYATHSSNEFKRYTDLGLFMTLFDKRCTGNGKTTCAMQYATNFERVLLVHHRLTLDDDYTNKYPDFVSYQTNTTSSKQTVCYNSLHKINIKNYDLIIIDEIRSILRQSEMKNMLFATHTLFNIFENHHTPLIMLDANMTNSDVEFIQSFRKDNKAIVIHDNHNLTGKEVFVYLGHTSKEYVRMMCKIQASIENNEKVVIIYNRSIETINAFLAPFESTKRILHINRLTRSSYSMCSDTWYDEYDIIAYSPTISEGVSITDSRFASVKAYGLFTSTSSPAESVSQMVARFRAINTFLIHVDIQMKKSGVPLLRSMQEVDDYVTTNVGFLSCNVERRNGELSIIRDDFFRLYCKNMIETSQDYHNYSATLIQKLVNNGYKVYYASFDETEVDLDYAESTAEQESIENERICRGIVDAPMLSYDAINALKDTIQTEEDSFKVSKFMLASMLNVSSDALTIDMVDKFRKDSTVRSQIRNLKQCFCFMRRIEGNIERIPVEQLLKENVEVTVSNLEKMTSFGQQKKCVTTFTLSKTLWLNRTIRELGFDSLLSSEYVSVEHFDATMQNFVNYYSKNPGQFKRLCMLFDRSSKTACKVNSKFFESLFRGLFAIKFVRTNRGVHQKIMLPIQFYDENRRVPNLMGGTVILPDEIVQQYAHMFWKSCKDCNEMVPDLEEHCIMTGHMSSTTDDDILQIRVVCDAREETKKEDEEAENGEEELYNREHRKAKREMEIDEELTDRDDDMSSIYDQDEDDREDDMFMRSRTACFEPLMSTRIDSSK